MIKLPVLESDDSALVLELNGVQVHDERGVLLGLFLNVGLHSFLVFNGVALVLSH